MTDDQLESTLRRYRPVSAASELRERVIASALNPRVPLAAVDWLMLAAAASLLLAVIWPHADTGSRDPLAAAYADRLDQVAEDLGGDQSARDLAVVVIAAQSVRPTEEDQ